MTDTRLKPSTARELSTDPRELNHLVCCREEWKIAFCGTNVENAPINPNSRFLCAMCLDVVRTLRPSFEDDEREICPRDGTPCPDDLEIDARILYETR